MQVFVTTSTTNDTQQCKEICHVHSNERKSEKKTEIRYNSKSRDNQGGKYVGNKKWEVKIGVVRDRETVDLKDGGSREMWTMNQH